jgi:4'-phosphopantetheinyl transferase
LWRIDINRRGHEVNKLSGLLSDDEQARAARFRFETHRRRWIASRGMLRTILSTFSDTAPSKLEFSYEPDGKPYLATAGSDRPVHFNLTHSGDVALLAVTSVAPVGIDVEKVQPLRDINAVVDRFFCPAERETFHDLSDERLRLNAFYRCWTRKEAYLKAIGSGILQPTDTFEVAFLPEAVPSIVAINGSRSAASRWSLFNLEAMPGYIGALAMETRSRMNLVWHDVPMV